VTRVKALSEAELAAMAATTRRRLNERFGSERVEVFMRRDTEIAAAYAREIYYALRVALERKP
jgi:hypothetical protein